jgi:hypothetical protein
MSTSTLNNRNDSRKIAKPKYPGVYVLQLATEEKVHSTVKKMTEVKIY